MNVVLLLWCENKLLESSPLLTVFLWDLHCRKWCKCFCGYIKVSDIKCGHPVSTYTEYIYTSSNKNITFFHAHVIHKQHINACPCSCAHAHCSMSDKHRKAAGNMQLFIITMRRIARSASLRCHWDLTATSACMLFIYTSYKSVSPDLQRKLCQASWEITGCECASAKSSRRKAGAFKQNYSTFSYSNETCSKCTCMYINLHQTNQLPNEIHMFSFSFFLGVGGVGGGGGIVLRSELSSSSPHSTSSASD